jgi:hypothetical protein
MSNQTPQSVSYGLLPVSLRLELIAEYHGATAVAKSARIDGRRVVRIGLCKDHLLVSKALARADTLTIRFLISLSLTEFCLFWSSARDGAVIRNELKKIAGFAPGDQAWGSAFASRLAISEPMRVIDSLPIYGKSPEAGPFELFSLEVPQRSPSDITNWRFKNGQAETVKPLLPRPPKQKQEPASVVAVAVPDPFLASFHATAKEILDEATFRSLEELSKGDADV